MIEKPLNKLSDDYGMSLDEMMESSIFDGISPGICLECGYTTDVEPDNDQGWCEECEANTVKSACVLAGVI